MHRLAPKKSEVFQRKKMFGFGFGIEIWFKGLMMDLRMLDLNPPSIEEIKKVLLKYLSSKTHKAIRHLRDESDGEEWLDLALKVDCLIVLEDEHSESIRVGIDVTGNPNEVSYKLELIESKPFQIARQKLGISKHWIVLIDPDRLPGKDWIIDRFYAEVDSNNEIAVLKF